MAGPLRGRKQSHADDAGEDSAGAVAQGFGVATHRAAESMSDVRDMLPGALRADRPVLIDVLVDRFEVY